MSPLQISTLPTDRAERLAYILTNYGWNLVLGMAVLVAGVLIVRYLVHLLSIALQWTPLKPAVRATILLAVKILLYVSLIAVASVLIGFKSENIFKFLMVICLAAVAVTLMFRPYLPSLPFKEGNTIKSGGLLGRVEAITFLNTRMRTFDGKTVWIPNSKLFQDYLVNYHYTPSRKIHLDVTIGYEADLLHAKQTLEAVMIEDARVLSSPRPVVYVINLLADCVAIGGRCWVPNNTYWLTRCDLLEKVKLRFDLEGIDFSLPQRILHVNYPERLTGTDFKTPDQV
jgi:small conductance mechanosensitive channel